VQNYIYWVSGGAHTPQAASHQQVLYRYTHTQCADIQYACALKSNPGARMTDFACPSSYSAQILIILRAALSPHRAFIYMDLSIHFAMCGYVCVYTRRDVWDAFTYIHKRSNTDGINAPLIIMFPPTTARAVMRASAYLDVCTSRRHLMRKNTAAAVESLTLSNVCVLRPHHNVRVHSGDFFILHRDNYLWKSLPPPCELGPLFRRRVIHNVYTFIPHPGAALWGCVIRASI